MGLGSGVAAIAAGAMYTCALLTSGEAKCWGYNSDGEAGDGSFVDVSIPAATVVDLSGATTISACGDHTCAMTLDGAAKCWGDGWAGQLGNGSADNQPKAVDVVGL
jgi:alpha-tubulin suppressor-like RCC1 family protein